MAYTLPDLPYGYDALEPHYDEQTLRLHHDKHHAGYVTKLNAALEKIDKAHQSGEYGNMRALAKDVAFNGSGHILHSIFWPNMKPNGGGTPTGELASQIETDFGSFDNFKQQFINTAMTITGSGWGVLGWSRMLNRLFIVGTQDHQDLTLQGLEPLLVVDMWEHAFYLKWQNNKGDWVDTFVNNLVNWDNVAENFSKAKQGSGER